MAKICLDSIQTADLVNFLRDLAGESKRIPLTYIEVTLRASEQLKFGIGDKTVAALCRKLGVKCDRKKPALKTGSPADRLAKIEEFLEYQFASDYRVWMGFDVEGEEDDEEETETAA